MAAAPAQPASPREVIRAARRVVVKVGSSSLTLRGGGAARRRERQCCHGRCRWRATAPMPLRRLAPALRAPGPRSSRDRAMGPRSSRGCRQGSTSHVSTSSSTPWAMPVAGARSWSWCPPGPSPRGSRRWACGGARATSPPPQAAASVGQGILMAHYHDAFARHDRTVGQVLLTADDLIRRAHYRNAQRTLERLLELDVVPIVNENDTVATAEIRFGDNDRLAALVAHLVRADALILLSDVDGLYDGPPDRGGSRLIPRSPRPRTLRTSWSAGPAPPASAWAGWAPRSRPPGSPPRQVSRSS